MSEGTVNEDADAEDHASRAALLKEAADRLTMLQTQFAEGMLGVVNALAQSRLIADCGKISVAWEVFDSECAVVLGNVNRVWRFHKGRATIVEPGQSVESPTADPSPSTSPGPATTIR